MAEVRVVRNGDGDAVPGEHWLFKAVAGNTDGLFDFMVGPVEPFSGPPLHVHAEQSDTFLVLDGVLTVQARDEIHELGPGDFVTVPPGVPHTFDNLDAEVEVLAVNVMVPGGLHDFFAERASALQAGAATTGLGAKYGMTVVGPTIRDAKGSPDVSTSDVR